jgi:hypothetical protein
MVVNRKTRPWVVRTGETASAAANRTGNATKSSALSPRPVRTAITTLSDRSRAATDRMGRVRNAVGGPPVVLMRALLDAYRVARADVGEDVRPL